MDRDRGLCQHEVDRWIFSRAELGLRTTGLANFPRLCWKNNRPYENIVAQPTPRFILPGALNCNFFPATFLTQGTHRRDHPGIRLRCLLCLAGAQVVLSLRGPPLRS